MMSEWYQSESMDKPTEWDTTSSPTVVYQRKSIAEQIRKGIDGEKRPHCLCVQRKDYDTGRICKTSGRA